MTKQDYVDLVLADDQVWLDDEPDDVYDYVADAVIREAEHENN